MDSESETDYGSDPELAQKLKSLNQKQKDYDHKNFDIKNIKKKDIEKGNRQMFIIKQKNNLLSKMCE